MARRGRPPRKPYAEQLRRDWFADFRAWAESGAAAAAWQAAIYQHPELEHQRRAMITAASALLDHAEPELAEWLMCAWPHARTRVCSGVAAHALRALPVSIFPENGHPWDVLGLAELLDWDLASRLFETGGPLDWEPPDGDLVPCV